MGLNTNNVEFSTDSSGNVTGLVGPEGAVIPMLYSYQNAWVGFGDSIMNANGGPNIGAGVNKYDKGWVTWASASLGGRLNCVRNAGVSGDTTAMMLARLEIDVTPYASQARICIFNGGVNDPNGGLGVAATFAETKTNLTAIITRLRKLFPVVVWCTPTPYAFNATVAAKTAQIADWVRQSAPLLQGVLLCDSYGALINKTATTGDMVTGYSSDSPQLHPNAAGAKVIGAELSTVLTPYFPWSAPLPVSQANTVANLTATYATQVLPNPLLVNNVGTISGTNVTSAGAGGLAGAPIDWTVRAGTGGVYTDGTTAVTCQLVARSDGYGNDVQLVQTAGANAGTPVIELLTASHHADVSAGQRIQGVFTLSMSGASNVKKIILYMTVTDSNGTSTLTALTNDGAAFTQSDFSNFVFKTEPYTLGSSITALRLRVDITGIDKTAAATYKLGKLAILILP